MRHMRIWRYVDEVARAGSLRQAAERLNVTASALQRRIQDVEEDLGTKLFERLPTGMRLTAAGETFIRWVRSQASDLDRVRSQIEDLSGLRRGLVRIACSQAVAAFLLPHEIAHFTAAHPSVHFAVSVSDHKRAVTMLRDYEADLALVFQPDRYPEFAPLTAVPQRLMAIMAADHPLAARDVLRLRDCAAFPLALLDTGFAGRQIADAIIGGGSAGFDIRVEANSAEFLRVYVSRTQAITLQIEIGAVPDMLGEVLVARPIDDQDQMHGSLVLGQLRGRDLPIAAARFADQLIRRLDVLQAVSMVPGAVA
jgi:DNA-binding transcriptional LysR family regulator